MAEINSKTYKNRPLAQLRVECQKQISTYHKTQTEESQSCLEIVRRAATGDIDALTILCEMNQQFVYPRCPSELYDQREDILQEVNIRLTRRFQNQQKRFTTSSFGEYRSYINTILDSVLRNPPFIKVVPDSLDAILEQVGSEPSIPDNTQEFLRYELADAILAILTDRMEREAFRRRMILEQSYEEIVEELRPLDPDMTKQKVYRLVERALRRIKKDPRLPSLL
ncbi:MAG: sigma-70 family RNA polymerase sigma factor [Chloroflexota bacterium]